MKAVVSKKLIAGAVAALSLFGAANARADAFNPFTVQPTASSQQAQFTADKIVGGYVERITFNTDNTFNVSLLWNASSFWTADGTKQVNDTGLNDRDGYQLYALYTAGGTYTLNSAGQASFNFTPGTGGLTIYLDPGYGSSTNQANRTTFGNPPATGTGTWAVANNSDDIILATGNPVFGAGNLDPTLSTCSSGSGAGINCGSFGSETTIALTAAGKQFFVSPTQFYNFSFQSGQLNNFTVAGNQTVNGSMDVVFNTQAVPEPASLGLLGLGLLGLGVARRRKQS